MLQSKTRISVTWFVLSICALTILGAFIMGEMESVILAAIGSVTSIGMFYIGGKTFDNVKRKQNEVKN